MERQNLTIAILLLTIVTFFTSLSAQALNDKIDAMVEQYIQLGQFSGTILVVKDGQAFYAKAFGEAN